SADRVPPRVRRLVVPLTAGWHRVAVKIAGVGGRAEAELALWADPPLESYGGDAAAAPATAAPKRAVVARAVEPPLPDAREAPQTMVERALVDYLAAHAAFRSGDADAGE